MAVTYEQITGLSSAKALTLPAGCRKAVVRAESQAVRYRLDGATASPTASSGQRLLTTDPPLEITAEGGLSTVKFIEESSSAKLNVHYFT